MSNAVKCISTMNIIILMCCLFIENAVIMYVPTLYFVEIITVGFYKSCLMNTIMNYDTYRLMYK